MVLNNKQHLSSSAGCFCVLVRSSGAAGRPSLDASGALDSSSGVWPETRCVHPDSSEPSDLLQGEEAWGGKWSSSVWGERDVGLTDLCLVVLLGFLQLTSQLVFTALECERKNIFSVFLIWWLLLCNKEEGTLCSCACCSDLLPLLLGLVEGSTEWFSADLPDSGSNGSWCTAELLFFSTPPPLYSLLQQLL